MFRFKVLLDTELNPTLVNTTANNAAGTAGASIYAETQIRYHKFLKLGNKMTNFSASTNPMTNSSISTGSLYLILRSPDTGAALESWTLKDTSTARLRYVD